MGSLSQSRGSTDSSMQWAAVRTHSLEMREPPQKYMSSMKRATWWGHELGWASTPPTMRGLTADETHHGVKCFGIQLVVYLTTLQVLFA